MKSQDTNNASFCYSVNLLRMLLDMKLITKEEYDRIIEISATHYGTEKYVSELITLRKTAGCIRTLVV